MSDVAVAVLLLAGAILSFTAGVGLLHFPDLLSRLHTGAKPQVVGLLAALVAVGLRVESPFDVGTGIFQLVTAPVAAHMTARAAYRAGKIAPGLVSADDLARDIAESRGDR